MKRSVAIVGPTPAFLRWAIERGCPLREPVDERLASSTFRQLRGLRELALCQIENRVIDGICLHPDAEFGSPDVALGFSAAEIADPYGGLAFVQSCCRDCPANAASEDQPGILAGCYGWLPVDLKTDFEVLVRGHHRPNPPNTPGEWSIVEFLEQVIVNLSIGDELRAHFQATHPVWFGLWADERILPASAARLEPVFRSLLQSVEQQAGCSTRDLRRFVDALKLCCQHELTMCVELVPGGFSDGSTWTLNRHCRVCKFEASDQCGENLCPCCEQASIHQNQIKSKVLGLRPYMNLNSIYGAAKTRDVISAFVQNRENNP